MQIVDVNADGVLELVAGSDPTAMRNVATGALVEELPGLVRFIAADGDLQSGPLEGPLGFLDLDGDGLYDDVERRNNFDLVVAGQDFSLELGPAIVALPGPGPRAVTVFDETQGALTWSLTCGP